MVNCQLSGRDWVEFSGGSDRVTWDLAAGRLERPEAGGPVVSPTHSSPASMRKRRRVKLRLHSLGFVPFILGL